MKNQNVQFIELQNDFYLFNNLNVIDALDADKTEFKILQDIIVGAN